MKSHASGSTEHSHLLTVRQNTPAASALPETLFKWQMQLMPLLCQQGTGVLPACADDHAVIRGSLVGPGSFQDLWQLPDMGKG